MTKVFSEDGAHLYSVQVNIPQPVRWVRRIVFVLDAPCLSSDGDTTMLSRCLGFATIWGGTSLSVVSLTTLFDRSSGEPTTGPDAAAHIRAEVRGAALVIAAWGDDICVREPVWTKHVRDVLLPPTVALYCLGVTANNNPIQVPPFSQEQAFGPLLQTP